MRPTSTLGNFLSGMETGLGELPRPHPVHLGNFLSGMETLAVVVVEALRDGALETSLVEWKPFTPS